MNKAENKLVSVQTIKNEREKRLHRHSNSNFNDIRLHVTVSAVHRMLVYSLFHLLSGICQLCLPVW